LIFEPSIAASQDFDTIYTICLEGFQELCQLDPRFVRFGKTIFSQQSRNEERTQMTSKENEELDVVLEEFLGLVGARLLLKPGLRAVEWLVRRFRYAVYFMHRKKLQISGSFLRWSQDLLCAIYYGGFLRTKSLG
jgi:U3 small nucleolar RNA-associated protein 10